LLKLEPWNGYVEPGFRVNFLGVRTRNYMALLEKPTNSEADSEARFVSASYPDFDEEYFQWIDLCEAVLQSSGAFTMLELGAGYGRWLCNAAAALRSLKRSEFRLIGVEAEPVHFQWMKLQMNDNMIDQRSLDLHEAAVSAEDGKVRFLIGNPSNWYGQSIWPPRTKTILPPSLKLGLAYLRRRVRTIKAISLTTLLRTLPFVDLVDLDVQGNEFEVLSAASDEICHKVRRIHIGTHGNDIEAQLRSLFQRLQWKNKFDFPSDGESDTQWGKIMFQDGVQSWVNPNMD
jgi:FkbM family methyltransferase